jgi:catechol 2,3-dioxygenase-like lactoylglutathione lyase family enzyme
MPTLNPPPDRVPFRGIFLPFHSVEAFAKARSGTVRTPAAMIDDAWAARVTAVRSVEFGVSDLARSLAFYEDVWKLTLVERDGERAYLRGTGSDHHIVVLRECAEPGLLGATFATNARAGIDSLHARVARFGGTIVSEPAAVLGAGGGYGFRFTDPAGRDFTIVSDVATHSDCAALPDRPVKISHLVLNAADPDRDTAFMRDALGFRLRDQTARMNFLGCNADHHSVAIVRGADVSLNHVAFEVPDLDSLMRGAAGIRRAGHPLEWGIGRHGPGNNVFAYFCDPDDLAIEYTAQIQQVDDASYRPGTPEQWQPPIPGNPDYWGFAALPSERFKRASERRKPAHAVSASVS